MAATNDDVGTQTIAVRGVVALVLALGINLLILQSVFTLELTGTTEDLEYQATIVVTTIGVAGATVVYGILSRVSACPNERFVQVAVVALLLSFLPNIGLFLAEDGPATDEIVVLAIMHIPPAVTCIASLTGGLFTQFE